MDIIQKLLKGEDRVDLTPMIDVVFLLLIFFMVTTTIIREESDLGIKLPTSVAAASDAPLPEEFLIDILPDGGILFNGVPISEPTPDHRLPELVATLIQIRQAADRSGFSTVVLLNPDLETPQQFITNVLNACVTANVKSVTFASGE
ncbi:MAG: biopolymer transport protein ExbD [Lentimonas sp.]|jgi:biopolymer transport protein ExbD